MKLIKRIAWKSIQRFDNNGAPIDHFTYQYDQIKNISSILSDNSQVNYEYDERNQLTKEYSLMEKISHMSMISKEPYQEIRE